MKEQDGKRNEEFPGDSPAHFGHTGQMPRSIDSRKAHRSTQRGMAQGTYASTGFANVSSAGKASSKSTKVPAKAALIAIGIFVLILAIVYGVGAYTFHGRFYPHTTLGAIDISMDTHSDASNKLAEVERNYEVAVSGEGLDFVVSAQDGGVAIDAGAVIAAAASDCNPWLWFVEIWGNHDVTEHLAATSDEGVLGEYVRAQVDAFNEEAEPSQDASIVFSAGSGSYEIKQEVYGNQIDVDSVVKAVATAIAGMEDSVNVGEEMLIKPSVLSSDERLASGRDAANSMVKCDVVLKSSDGGVVAGEVDGSVVSQWISFDDSFAPVLDEDAMGSWIDSLAASYNTIGVERTYTRGDGKKVTVSGGDYGWSVDSDSLKAAVKDAIENGTEGDLEISFSSTGNGFTKPGMDWGAYCDVDLTEQHAYYYDASGELLWDSGIVSGVPDEENSTPTGVYWLKALQKDVSLKGPIDPKTNKPKWDSPVDYWMPFVGNLVGLHDADWQPSWVFSDSSAYKTYGSHGCVNLPTKKAGQLFNIIQIGDPVIVHW